MNIYDFKAKDINGEEVSLEKYRGKVVVIANTASKCGFTPQYEDLQRLYCRYNSKGLEILGFPCNQFMEQEPGDSNDIKMFCTLNYGLRRLCSPYDRPADPRQERFQTWRIRPSVPF